MALENYDTRLIIFEILKFPYKPNLNMFLIEPSFCTRDPLTMLPAWASRTVTPRLPL